jgi:hypothetical protein
MKKILVSVLFAIAAIPAFGQIYVSPPVVVIPAPAPVCAYPEYGGAYYMDPAYGAYYFMCGGVRFWMPIGWDWRIHGFYHGPYFGDGRGRFNGERYGEGRYHYNGHEGHGDREHR